MLRFTGSTTPLVSAPRVPATGTLFIVYGGSAGSEAFGRPIGWANSAGGHHGVDILPLQNLAVVAIFFQNAYLGGIIADVGGLPSARTLEVEALSCGPEGVTFERRFTDGTRQVCP